jgi:hypothetical protein
MYTQFSFNNMNRDSRSTIILVALEYKNVKFDSNYKFDFSWPRYTGLKRYKSVFIVQLGPRYTGLKRYKSVFIVQLRPCIISRTWIKLLLLYKHEKNELIQNLSFTRYKHSTFHTINAFSWLPMSVFILVNLRYIYYIDNDKYI